MNHFIRLFFCGMIVGICYFFIGCSSTNNTNIYEGKLRYEYDTIFKTYRANFGAVCRGAWDMLTNNNTTYVAYNNCSDNTIRIINLANDSVIVLSNVAYNKHMNTRLQGNDVYTITPDNNVYLYCNGEGKRELIIDLMKLPTFQQSGLVVGRYKEGGDQHVNIPENILYFRMNYNYDDTMGVYSNMDFGFPTFAKLNIETKQIAFYGAMPYFAMYQTYGLPSNYYDLCNYYDLYIGDSIITSTGINGEIQIINTKNGEITQKEVKSRFDTVPVQKLVYPEGTTQYSPIKLHHYLLSPMYESLFYNPQTHYYYRIFHPHMNEYNEQGKPSQEYDKKSVLMILNEDFELVDEMMLPPIGYMTIVKLYPTENGVLISLPALWKVTPEEKVFSFLKIAHFEK